MKKIGILTSVLLLTTFLSFGQTRTAKDLIGKWAGMNDMFILEFIDSSTVVVQSMGQKQPAANYTLDFSKNPMWFDIILGKGKTKGTMKSILEFVDDDTIRWQSSPDNERPQEFKPSNMRAPVIILTRKK